MARINAKGGCASYGHHSRVCTVVETGSPALNEATPVAEKAAVTAVLYALIAKAYSGEIMDRRRAILTDSERSVLENETESDRYYQVVSRVRRKINEELPQDVQIIRQNHAELYQELCDVVEKDVEWLREEIESKRADIESEFPEYVVPKVTRFNNLPFGLWVRIHTGSEHMRLLESVEDVGDHLHALGYNVRGAYDGRYDPDVGDPHYEGHLYALPAESGMPEYPAGEMPTDSHQILTKEWRANKNITVDTMES